MSHSRTDYDVVIVGAGITGSIIANKLGQRGFRVLLIDAGDKLYFDRETGEDRRQELLDNFYEATARVPNSPYPNLKYAPMEFEDNLGTYYYGPKYDKPDARDKAPEPSEAPKDGEYGRYSSTYTRAIGGTTYHWLGTCLRYLPSTFEEKTLFGHAADWPFKYADLEPWYEKAEWEIGVSGDSRRDLGSPRRGKPFPMPMILQSYTDRVMAERLGDYVFEDDVTHERLPVLVEPTPQARNSVPFQDRPPCAGSSNCVPICPIQAKYDATVHLKRALNPRLDPGNKEGISVPVELKTGAVVIKVDVGEDGRVSGLVYKHKDERGVEHVARGRFYVLATHAIETAKILLMSADPCRGALKDGVANSSGLVGRYLMDHNVKLAIGMADVPLYPFRGPLSTSGIETLRDGAFRMYRAAFRVEIEAIGSNWALNSPFGVLNEKLSKGMIGEDLFRAVGWDVNRQVQLDALFEPMPNYDSRVTLARDSGGELVVDDLGVPRPRLDFVLDDYTKRSARAFEKVADGIIKRMGGPGATVIDAWFGAGHGMGTTRMGIRPMESVTDGHGRTWDHPNLFLTGSGLFPTVCSANPTLTITAVTLRQVERLTEMLSNPS